MALISSVSINSDGWSADVTIAGWAGEQGNISYDFSNFNLSVTSEGYSAAGVLGTVVRSVAATTEVRLPYPNETTVDEIDSGSDIVVRVALSDWVYDDDRNGGAGTSGADPVVSVGAGWASISGDSTEAFNASAANNSTLDYPKVVGQWDWANTPLFSRVESDFKMGFRARHGFGVAAVLLAAVGSVSAHSQSSTVNAISVQGPEQNGLYHESYDFTAPIAGFTQGEEIVLNATAYPVVGDADSIIDTSTNTDINDAIRGFTQITCHCDKTGALKQYAVVDAAGVDASGVVSGVLATAQSNPYLTIGAALADGATVIQCNTGTYDILGSNPGTVPSLDYAIDVGPSDGATVTLNRGGSFRTYEAKRLTYQNITVSYSSGNGWLDGENLDRLLQFKGCDFSNTAKPIVGLGYRSKGCWFTNCQGIGGDDHESFSSSRVAYSFTACSFSGNTDSDAFYTVVACSGNADVLLFDEMPSANPAPIQNNLIFEHNKLLGQVANGGSTGVRLGDSRDFLDASFIGNVLEVKSVSASGALLWISADGSGAAVRNCIVGHNTVSGERCNLFYNDSGSVANDRENIWLAGNAFRSYNIKSDTFLHPTDGRNGNRVGNWAMMYGVGYRDNRYDGSASSAFSNDFDGLNAAYVTANDSVFGEMQYSDEQSSDLGSAGGGDYTPTAGSVLNNQILTDPYIEYDLNGNPQAAQIGALFIAASGVSGSVVVPSTAALNATGQKVAGSSVVITEASAATVDGSKSVAGSIVIAHSSSAATVGNKTAGTEVSISAVSALSVSGSKYVAGIVDVVSSTSVSALGEKALDGTLSAAASSGVGATGSKSTGGVFDVVHTSGVTTTGSPNTVNSVSVSAASSVVADGSKSGGGSASVSAGSVTSGVGDKGGSGSVAVTQTASVSAAGSPDLVNSVSVNAVSVVTVSGTKVVGGSVSVPSSALTVVLGKKIAEGVVSISSVSSVGTVSVSAAEFSDDLVISSLTKRYSIESKTNHYSIQSVGNA